MIKSKFVTMLGAVAAISLTFQSLLWADDHTQALQDLCAEANGEVIADLCVVTTVEVSPFAESVIVRAAGKSGLAWTASGHVTATTVDMYELVVTTTTTTTSGGAGSNSQPNSAGACDQASGTVNQNNPNCNGGTTTTTITTYDLDLIASDTSYVQLVDGCFNPAGRNMGAKHQQCIHLNKSW